MLQRITLDSFHSEIMDADGSFLLACIPRGHGFKKQGEILENISKRYGPWVDVLLVAEDSIRLFGEKFGISGTPYFLIYEGGKQKGRLLGSAGKKRLKSFLLETLTNFQGER